MNSTSKLLHSHLFSPPFITLSPTKSPSSSSSSSSPYLSSSSLSSPLLPPIRSTNNDNNTPLQQPPDTVQIKFRRGSRKRRKQPQSFSNDDDDDDDDDDAMMRGNKQMKKKNWEEMSVSEKAIELYMGEKGFLFWVNKFAYASIFIIIGAWIVFRFVGPALNLYQLDSPPLSPESVFKGS